MLLFNGVWYDVVCCIVGEMGSGVVLWYFFKALVEGESMTDTNEQRLRKKH